MKEPKEYIKKLVGPEYDRFVDRMLPESFAEALTTALTDKEPCECCKNIVDGMKNHNYCFNCGREL